MHRTDRPDNPHGGVLIAAKKDLELHDIQSNKDLELICGTIKISKQKKMVISSYYRLPTHSDESYLKRAYDQISKHTASRKSAFILGGDFNVPDVSWKDNSITSSKHYSDARLFADDCLLYRHITSSHDQALLQEDLSALEKWEETWQMKFHPDKCMVIRISTNRKQILKTNYRIHGHTLEVVDSSKYLGVTIGENLAWKKHIDNTVNKANRNLGFIRRNLGDCTAAVKAAAYSMLVRLVLEYSSTVWDPHQSSDIHNLEQVQRRAARFVHHNYTE